MSQPAPGVRVTATARDRSESRPRVVVLGASIAGLLTAAALANHAEVTLVDRDPIEEDLTSPRRGVPQMRHTHGLLVGGFRAIESLLPGIGAELEARGAFRADVLGSSRWVLRGRPVVSFPTTLVGPVSSRTLLESQIRRRVLALDDVSALGGHDVVGPLTDAEGARITGVRVASRGAGSRAGSRDLEADLVVDALGRGSRLPRWLTDLGYAAPAVTEVKASVSYTTRVFDVPGSVLEGLDAVVVGTDVTTGASAAALRQEHGRWTVTLSQANGESPPTDLGGFSRGPGPCHHRRSPTLRPPPRRSATERSMASRRVGGCASRR